MGTGTGMGRNEHSPCVLLVRLWSQHHKQWVMALLDTRAEVTLIHGNLPRYPQNKVMNANKTRVREGQKSCPKKTF